MLYRYWILEEFVEDFLSVVNVSSSDTEQHPLESGRPISSDDSSKEIEVEHHLRSRLAVLCNPLFSRCVGRII